jgi:hypothetical protein
MSLCNGVAGETSVSFQYPLCRKMQVHEHSRATGRRLKLWDSAIGALAGNISSSSPLRLDDRSSAARPAQKTRHHCRNNALSSGRAMVLNPRIATTVRGFD